jgi:hypothetical protein
MINRERKVNLESMGREQLENLEKQMAKKLEDILSKAANEANGLLNIYGIKIKIAYELQQTQEAEA